MTILLYWCCTGVPLSQPVAGVACGLVTRQDSVTGDVLDYTVLTDIAVSIDLCSPHHCHCSPHHAPHTTAIAHHTTPHTTASAHHTTQHCHCSQHHAALPLLTTPHTTATACHAHHTMQHCHCFLSIYVCAESVF